MIKVENIKNNITDLNAVMDMIYDEWGMFFSKSKEEKIQKIKNSIENGLSFPQIYVMKENGEIVGSFMFKEHDLDEEEFASLSPWLACVIVRKDLRGKGYGKEILLQIDKVAKELYSHLYLFTKHIGYYEKIGFKFIKTIEHHGEINRVYKKEY